MRPGETVDGIPVLKSCKRSDHGSAFRTELIWITDIVLRYKKGLSKDPRRSQQKRKSAEIFQCALLLERGRQTPGFFRIARMILIKMIVHKIEIPDQHGTQRIHMSVRAGCQDRAFQFHQEPALRQYGLPICFRLQGQIRLAAQNCVVKRHAKLGAIPGRKRFPLIGKENGREAVHAVSARPHKNLLLLKLEGIDTVDQGDALRGRELLLIRRGWNADIDALRDRIRADYPDVRVEDFPQYRAEVFNRAANEDLALATLPVWRDVHPLLRTVPTDWGVTVSYGVLHAPEPAPHVVEFLDAVRAVA